MKKKLIIFGVLIIGITLLFSKIIKVDKEEFKKEAFKAEKILEKPAGIQAYTLEGKNTDISYSDLIKNYEIDSITCKNGTIATYIEATNEVSLSNVHIPDYCTMNFKERKTIALFDKLLEDNPTISTRTDFSTPFTTNTANTIYKATENGTVVYYFAGVDGMPAHCEYGGTIVQNADEGKELNKTQCLSEISLCQLEYDLVFGLSNDCENDYGGTLITTSDATWVEDGIPINNWLKFGGFYWRIIRTNNDGSIKLLYSGTSSDTTAGYIGRSAFNPNADGPKYVGYMYGDSDTTLEEARTNTNDSTIKTFVDTWYENNFTAYTNYLSNDAVYCNDRELASGETYSTSTSFTFKPSERLDDNKTPTYDCTNKKDAFSVNNTEAKLKYPIALMTADEIAYAGGVEGEHAPMWYYTNSTYGSIVEADDWFLLTPGTTYPNFPPDVYFMGSNDGPDYLNESSIYLQSSIRPVTSLKSCVQWKSGDGSADNPYEIVENGGY